MSTNMKTYFNVTKLRPATTDDYIAMIDSVVNTAINNNGNLTDVRIYSENVERTFREQKQIGAYKGNRKKLALELWSHYTKNDSS